MMMLFNRFLVSSSLFLALAIDANAQNSTFCDYTFLLPSSSSVELGIGRVEPVCNGDNDNDASMWFESVYHNSTLGNAIIRYRYCEYAGTHQVDWSDSCDHAQLRCAYENTITCSDYFVKTLPEKVAFRAFLGEAKTTVATGRRCARIVEDEGDYIRAFSSDGTVCFHGRMRLTQPELDHRCPDDWDGMCIPEGEAVCDKGLCQTVCESREVPGTRLNVVFNYLDGGRPRDWVEVEIDPRDLMVPPPSTPTITGGSSCALPNQNYQVCLNPVPVS